MLSKEERIKVVQSLPGVRITDSVIWIPRRNKKVEEILDKHFPRTGSNNLQWLLNTCIGKNINELASLIKDKDVLIVGKGPSLDSLKAEHIPKDMILIGINEAGRVIGDLDINNPVFGIQQDIRPGDHSKPSRGPILVSTKASSLYDYVEDKYVYDPVLYGLTDSSLTAICAVRILNQLGARQIYFVCFDACKTGQLGYAKSVKSAPESGGNLLRFLDHKKEIVKYAPTAIWLMLSDLSDIVSGKSLLSQQHQKEHHEQLKVPHSKDYTDKKDLP